MSWTTIQAFRPELPAHCEPANDFLYRLSSTFHTCVPSNLAFFSTLLGTLSIVAWLFAQLPQIYKNYALKSTSGLSILFLLEWCLGDLGNLLGAVFTRQATWQMVVAGYYCFVDSMLVLQWLWYEHLKHGRPLHWVRLGKSKGADSASRDGDMQQVIIEGVPILGPTSSTTDGPTEHTPPKDIQDNNRRKAAPVWRMPNFVANEGEGEDVHGEEKVARIANATTPSNRRIHRVQASSSIPSPSPRTVLFLACLISLARASPLHAVHAPQDAAAPSPLESAGSVLAWLSTLLYLGSRLPQLYKNYRRRSTAGLSWHLFAAAFTGNFFYSASILANPCAWHDYGAYGGGGWVGEDGSERGEWVARALPFWLGAAGVLALDGAVGLQFLVYGEGEGAEMVVLEEGPDGRQRRSTINGWMRGWAPSINEQDTASAENEALMPGARGDGYGAVE